MSKVERFLGIQGSLASRIDYLVGRLTSLLYSCRSTLSKIPETDALLKKARLPLGVLIHPFKDLSHLPVIQCTTIVRCRSCRTYINPFVHFVDQRRWRCNLCYRSVTRNKKTSLTVRVQGDYKQLLDSIL